MSETGRRNRTGQQFLPRVRIAFGSVTYAEKGRAVLASHGIPTRITRLDPSLTKKGCTYALMLTGTVPEKETLAELLTRGHVRFSEILSDPV